MPATAMSTSSFRHGPQRLFGKGCGFVCGLIKRKCVIKICRWLTISEVGASVMLSGGEASARCGGLVCQLPTSPPLAVVIDVLPIQLAAERLSRLAGVDCDSFQFAPMWSKRARPPGESRGISECRRPLALPGLALVRTSVHFLSGELWGFIQDWIQPANADHKSCLPWACCPWRSECWCR
jgi:hypothetical protein